jgi:3-oxoacyl-[acyl-carrier-protein] synthase-3
MSSQNPVYITAAGAYLPGSPIPNDEVEAYLGFLFGKPSRTKLKMLQQNGITTRYYAIDKNQQTTHTASGMTAAAIQSCLQKAGVSKKEIQFLSAATTQGDLPVPGFASMVHGDAQLAQCEIASHQSVCAAGMMAIKNAWLHIKAGETANAIACAGELPSRMFKAQRFEQQTLVREKNRLDLETDFLRWMLSDGAGALLLENQPARNQFSLRVDWIDLRSHAHLYDVCMYAGINKNNGSAPGSWMNYNSFSDADTDAAINLKQDLKLVQHIVPLGVQHFFHLIDQGRINPNQLDWLLCHYSSEYFKPQIVDLLQKGGCTIPPEKWFTNLHTKGNVGAASIFLMLEELLYSGKLQAGQTLLCMVPESGRFITSFMQLTVMVPAASTPALSINTTDAIEAPVIRTGGQPVQEWLVRQLTSVWVDFESGLRQVPIVQKIYNGSLTLEEYKLLLLNMRQQVIDGSQWIARAASNITIEYFDIRSAFITHSRDEHRDYQILEKNYIACGGTYGELQQGEKNIGSEALSAFMFHKASQPNPFDLLGGMFIIEGLGNRLAGKWGRAIQEQLQLHDDQVSFFIYHETSDANDNHFERFEKAIQSDLLQETIAAKIVKTAKITARLYTMQLQELGNY